MFSGRLVGIYIASAAADSTVALDECVVTAAGLAGDRYALGTGTYSPRGGAGRAVTLIEREVVDAVSAEYDVELAVSEARRNLVTEGVPLHHLIGSTFRVGDVVFRGVRSCPPCVHLERQTRGGVRRALENRGGLRADVVHEGTLRIGDEIVVVPT
jgi:MOSC domain-containing protein YiiM